MITEQTLFQAIKNRFEQERNRSIPFEFVYINSNEEDKELIEQIFIGTYSLVLNDIKNKRYLFGPGGLLEGVLIARKVSK